MRSLLPTERASYSDVRALVVLAHNVYCSIRRLASMNPSFMHAHHQSPSAYVILLSIPLFSKDHVKPPTT